MSLTNLVLDCLIMGTQFNESGKSVYREPPKGERVMFFRSDSPEFRKHVGIGIGKSCDLLVLCWTGTATPLISLIELKGKDVSSAIEQIDSTLTAIKSYLKDCPRLKKANFMAYVICSSVPHQAKQRQRDFQKKHNVSLQIASQKKFELPC